MHIIVVLHENVCLVKAMSHLITGHYLLVRLRHGHFLSQEPILCRRCLRPLFQATYLMIVKIGWQVPIHLRRNTTSSIFFHHLKRRGHHHLPLVGGSCIDRSLLEHIVVLAT